ncbi:MAG: acetyltransferase [Acidobacteriota bacterium]|nr:acetyltransferase [Acidobacteriota bacterium]
MTRRRLAIIGAGGFAREVRWLVSEINSIREQFEFVGFLVSDLDQLGDHDSRQDVIGDFSILRSRLRNLDAVALGIGSPSVRARLAREIGDAHPELEWPALVHPSARFDSTSCSFEKGTIVCAGVVATVNVRVESFAMINLACTLGHEAVVGFGSVLNPTVNVSGGVKIGNQVLIGTGAQILQYITIEDNAVVGAGAVVTKDVGVGQTVVGVPARPSRSD